MKTWKPFVLASSLLAFFAVGGGLLVGSLPTLRAAQESGKSPRASLQIARHPPRVSFLAVEPGRSSDDSIENYQRYLTTQGTLIKSRLVLDAALQDRGVSQLPSIKSRPDPIAWLQQNLEVTNLKDTEILQVSLAPGFGASGSDQAAIINAVVRAYINEVANVDVKRRTDRYNQLRKIKEQYAEILHERRETLRKRSTSSGRGESLTALAKDALPRLYHDLRTQRVKLRLERAEAETLLARRKEVPGSATDPVRSKEIAQIEDRLAVLSAGQKVLDEELEQASNEMRGAADQSLDLKAMIDEIAQVEDASRMIGAEVEALNVELEAPARIRLIEDAVSPRP
jgi:hypothetical protein